MLFGAFLQQIFDSLYAFLHRKNLRVIALYRKPLDDEAPGAVCFSGWRYVFSGLDSVYIRWII